MPTENTLSNQRAKRIVWTLWAVISLMTLGLIAGYGFTLPFADGWLWMPVAAGQQGFTLQWLWESYNQHRLVLPKAIYYLLGEATNWDLRAVPLLNVAILSGLSVVLIRVSARLRGRYAIEDAFFPLCLLTWTQFINLAWSVQICYVLFAGLLGLLLAVIASTRHMNFARLLLITLLSTGMGLCGAYGLLVLPGIGVWLTYVGIRTFRESSPQAKRDGAATIAVSLLWIPYCLLYAEGWKSSGNPPPEIWPVLRTSTQFLSISIGPMAKELWPFSGLLLLAGSLAAMAQLVRVIRRHPEERNRATGLLAFLAAIGALALGIGWGRAYLGERAGLMLRYSTLATPLLCLFFIQAGLFSRTMTAKRLQRVLFLMICVLTIINTRKGFNSAVDFRYQMTLMENDMRNGLAPAAVARRHRHWNRPANQWRIEMLRDAGLNPYRKLPDVLPLAEVALHDFVLLKTPDVRDGLTKINAGDELTQCFPIETAGQLNRIDVNLGKWQGSRSLGRANWELREIAQNQSATLLAAGDLDLHRTQHDGFITLHTGPIVLHPGSELKLVLRMQAEHSGQRHWKIPLFRHETGSSCDLAINGQQPHRGRCLKGFLFVQPLQKPSLRLAEDERGQSR